jgi:hypothetical protein
LKRVGEGEGEFLDLLLGWGHGEKWFG